VTGHRAFCLLSSFGVYTLFADSILTGNEPRFVVRSVSAAGILRVKQSIKINLVISTLWFRSVSSLLLEYFNVFSNQNGVWGFGLEDDRN
jgi:hypothetical protein